MDGQARSMKTWMEEFGVDELDWSEQSPELFQLQRWTQVILMRNDVTETHMRVQAGTFGDIVYVVIYLVIKKNKKRTVNQKTGPQN